MAELLPTSTGRARLDALRTYEEHAAKGDAHGAFNCRSAMRGVGWRGTGTRPFASAPGGGRRPAASRAAHTCARRAAAVMERTTPRPSAGGAAAAQGDDDAVSRLRKRGIAVARRASPPPPPDGSASRSDDLLRRPCSVFWGKLRGLAERPRTAPEARPSRSGYDPLPVFK